MTSLERDRYARWYGPTTGDRVRLADSCLWIEVERDFTTHGDELLGGCGKTAREGLLVGRRPGEAGASALDLVVTGVVVVDPALGVCKANIGVKDGRIVAIGSAGNPTRNPSVDLPVDAHTAIVTGEGLIATPGIVDSHVHLSSPAIVPAALSTGTTTVVGMGTGGVWDVGANPAYNLHTLMSAWRDVPINAAFLARGSSNSPWLLEAAASSGAGGFKVHEDWGATPHILDVCLDVAEAVDLPVAVHTDSLNESGYLADTIAATGGRTVHAYHVEGGGGHPDLLEILSEPHVLASSTTPTIPYTTNTLAELFPMTMTVHRQNPDFSGDVAVTHSRIRARAIAAENVLHDLGAISILNSDSMGMGRIAEPLRRGLQLAHVHALRSGEGGPERSANERVLRYLAKLTLNPAIAHGMSHEVGSLQPGRLADIVLWNPAYFGAKPELVLKSGFVAWGVSGSGSGSTRLCQPRRFRSYFGAMGDAAPRLSCIFVASEALEDSGSRRKLPSGLSYTAIRSSRRLTRQAMQRNTLVPRVQVPLDGSPVLVDGETVDFPPAESLPLTRLHHLA